LINWRQIDQHVELELEYCSLGSLSTTMSKAKAELGLLFTHIASGLEHIHGHDLIHRDIKPDNILVQQVDGQLCFKLADFGYSNTVNDAFTFCGSPLYMAPEVCLRERQTPRLDIYSLGVVFLDVLGCLQGIGTTRIRQPREGWQPIISRKAVGLNPGQDDANFIRRMISRNAIHRPTATQCLEFLKGNAGQPSIETLHTKMNPSVIAASHTEAQFVHEPDEPADYEVRPVYGRYPPRFQRTGFTKNLISAPPAGLWQDPLKIKPQLYVGPFVSGKTQGLQLDDIAQVDQMLRARRHRADRRYRNQPSKLTKRVDVQPIAVTEKGGLHPKILQHQKKTQDGKIVKRNSEKGKARNQMPGAWID
jgi:serine/threonine protein kinase